MSEERETWDYDSGPFCEHWGEPGACEVLCDFCGHECGSHAFYDDRECQVQNCSCKAFVRYEKEPTA